MKIFSVTFICLGMLLLASMGESLLLKKLLLKKAVVGGALLGTGLGAGLGAGLVSGGIHGGVSGWASKPVAVQPVAVQPVAVQPIAVQPVAVQHVVHVPVAMPVHVAQPVVSGWGNGGGYAEPQISAGFGGSIGVGEAPAYGGASGWNAGC